MSEAKPGDVLNRALCDLVHLCAVDGIGNIDMTMEGVMTRGEDRGNWRLRLERVDILAQSSSRETK